MIKKCLNLAILVTFLIFLSHIGGVAQAQTQASELIDAFTFFIPYPTEILDDQFNIGFAGGNLIGEDIETIIPISVHRDGSIIYYDHWEDGLESNLTQPTQPSTQVWGDNNPANGIPPGFSADILNSGDVIILRNLVELDAAGQRDPAVLFYDGGDMLTSVGGVLAVTLIFWAQGPSILYTDAWELYPTGRWGTDYRIPIGEDLAPIRPGFTVAGLNVQAVKQNTTIEIDLDADGSFETTITLNQGEQFTTINGVRTGAQVRASGPVQVHVFTANPASQYEARGYTMLPVDQWTDDYLAPRSSDGDFLLHNPHGSDLEIRIDTITNTTTLVIPANSTAKFPPVGLSVATGVHFTSTDGRPFYGVGALDEADAQDWGYALLPRANLTTQTLIGLGIGNNNNPGPPPNPDGDESRAYVTALSDTTVFVDYDNDGTIDASFPVSALAETPITDPDHNLTGAFLFTDDGTPFAIVWGQDESAPPAEPSIDVGTSIVPVRSLGLQKTFHPIDADCTGSITQRDTIRFELEYFNNSATLISNVIIEDNLPPQVTYKPNSIVLKGVPIPDATSGTPFLFDEGGYNVGDIEPHGSGNLTFDVVINEAVPVITNQAIARSDRLPSETASVTVTLPTGLPVPILEIDKVLTGPTSGPIVSGQIITFSLAITNTGNGTITSLPLQDIFNEDHFTFLNASPPPDMTASGIITWNNLTTAFGALPAATTVNTTVSFMVDSLPSTVTNILNTATILEAHSSDSLFPLICQANAIVPVVSSPEPMIHLEKSTNGFDADNPNTDPVPHIKPGDPVTWDYIVTNPGNVPLSNVTLVDDQLASLGVTPSFIGGDANNDGNLDLDETWVYQAISVAEDLPNSNWPKTKCGPGGSEAPTYANLATVTGQFNQAIVADEDPSHYCPPATPATSTPPPRSTPPASVLTPTPLVVQSTPTPILPVLLLPETGLRESGFENLESSQNITGPASAPGSSGVAQVATPVDFSDRHLAILAGILVVVLGGIGAAVRFSHKD